MEAEHDYCRSERDKLKAKLACADMEVTTLRARVEALESALDDCVNAEDERDEALARVQALEGALGECLKSMEHGLQWSPYRGESEETDYLRGARKAVSRARSVLSTRKGDGNG